MGFGLNLIKIQLYLSFKSSKVNTDNMDKLTIDTYNQLADEYDTETSIFWDIFPRTFLDKFINLSGQLILDVGSGPGRDGLLLQQANKKVVCVDASPTMLKMSAAKGLESILADFTHLPFPDQNFSGVWSYTSLLHIPKKDLGEALNETHRVLANKGIFALGLIEGDSEGYRENLGEDMSRWFSYYQKSEAQTLVESHGFRMIYFETFKPGSRNYLNFIFQKN